jgi:hypothetical protein
MFLYYFYALAEKTLSYLPFGKNMYTGVGNLVARRAKGRFGAFGTSFKLTRRGKELIPPGGAVLDVGTGWFHHDAFLLYLVGDYRIHLFDVEDKATLFHIKNYLNHLLRNTDLIAKELDIDRDLVRSKLEKLLQMGSRKDVYAACNFVPCITRKTDEPFLPENSIDFMVSNCAINHIPVDMLVPELKSLRKMLKKEGLMYFLIGHDDHWTFHDGSANQFNYYRYSDRFYKVIFESFEFHNRLVKQEWLSIFEQCGLEVVDYDAYVTDSSRKEIANLPHIDSRFAKYPLEELAIIYSYVLLRKRID